MTEPQEREELESLLMTPGWIRFASYAKEQWGPVGYGMRLKRAIAQAREAKTDLGEAVARVDAANDAVNELLSWVQARVTQLLEHEARRKREQSPTLSRRGTL